MSVEKVGGEMVVVLNEGEVCILLDVLDERIIGFAFVYVVVSWLL